MLFRKSLLSFIFFHSLLCLRSLSAGNLEIELKPSYISHSFKLDIQRGLLSLDEKISSQNNFGCLELSIEREEGSSSFGASLKRSLIASGINRADFDWQVKNPRQVISYENKNQRPILTDFSLFYQQFFYDKESFNLVFKSEFFIHNKKLDRLTLCYKELDSDTLTHEDGHAPQYGRLSSQHYGLELSLHSHIFLPKKFVLKPQIQIGVGKYEFKAVRDQMTGLISSTTEEILGYDLSSNQLLYRLPSQGHFTPLHYGIGLDLSYLATPHLSLTLFTKAQFLCKKSRIGAPVAANNGYGGDNLPIIVLSEKAMWKISDKSYQIGLGISFSF